RRDGLDGGVLTALFGYGGVSGSHPKTHSHRPRSPACPVRRAILDVGRVSARCQRKGRIQPATTRNPWRSRPHNLGYPATTRTSTHTRRALLIRMSQVRVLPGALKIP